MKKIFSYIKIILLFIVIDALIRSFMPAIYAANAHGGVDDFTNRNDFWNTLLFYIVYFILFFSWFYWPIVVFFLLISNFFKKEHYFFIVGGLTTALLFYLLYCKLYSILEVGSSEFYVRIVMYSLMGAYFGSFHFKKTKMAA